MSWHLFALWLLLILTSAPSFAIERPEQMGNFLTLEAGEYIYTNDHPSLDAEMRNNFAIDFWFKLEDLPQLPLQQRVILAKPGSYAIVAMVEVRYFTVNRLPLPSTFVTLRVIGFRDGGSAATGWMAAEPGKWRHIFFQRWVAGGKVHQRDSHDGAPGLQGVRSPAHAWCDDTDSRLYVGDVPREALEGFAGLDFPYEPIVSSRIHLDELRLSTAPISPPGINHPPEVDDKTMALWHFDEDANLLFFRDNSPFKNTLRRVGALSVTAKGALVTTWARLKSDNFKTR